MSTNFSFDRSMSVTSVHDDQFWCLQNRRSLSNLGEESNTEKFICNKIAQNITYMNKDWLEFQRDQRGLKDYGKVIAEGLAFLQEHGRPLGLEEQIAAVKAAAKWNNLHVISALTDNAHPLEIAALRESHPIDVPTLLRSIAVKTATKRHHPDAIRVMLSLGPIYDWERGLAIETALTRMHSYSKTALVLLASGSVQESQRSHLAEIVLQNTYRYPELLQAASTAGLFSDSDTILMTHRSNSISNDSIQTTEQTDQDYVLTQLAAWQKPRPKREQKGDLAALCCIMSSAIIAIALLTLTLNFLQKQTDKYLGL